MAVSVFNANVDWTKLSICMIALIVFTIAFELMVHEIEHAVKPHKYYKEMVEKLFKELMILGFVSFSLLLAVELGTDPTTEWFVTLEVAHLWIFFVA